MCTTLRIICPWQLACEVHLTCIHERFFAAPISWNLFCACPRSTPCGTCQIGTLTVHSPWHLSNRHAHILLLKKADFVSSSDCSNAAQCRGTALCFKILLPAGIEQRSLTTGSKNPACASPATFFCRSRECYLHVGTMGLQPPLLKAVQDLRRALEPCVSAQSRQQMWERVGLHQDAAQDASTSLADAV